MTFDPRAALAEVDDLCATLRDQQQQRARLDYEEAVETAGKYAEHLAAGGDPRKYEEPPVRENESRWNRSRLVPYKSAVEAVWDRYNATLGTDGIPFSPIHYGKKWSVARYALQHVGEPILYSTLGDLGGSLSKMSSEDVATVLATLQQTNGRDLIVRRLRVDGKVAYLLRPRQAMEDPVGTLDEDGTPKYRVDPMSIPLEKKTKAGAS